MNLKFSKEHREVSKVYIYADPEFTLTYFSARSNLVSYAFKKKKRTVRTSLNLQQYLTEYLF